MYEMVFLSDLLKKSGTKPHPDFVASMDYIYNRISQIQGGSPTSQFNVKVRWLKKILPRFFLVRILYCFRYDAMMGFSENEGNREIYGMISFQKHPRKRMIGMFDIYVSPSHRDKDIIGNFQKMAGLVYELSQRFKDKDYRYLQCGYNPTTRKILELYRRIVEKNHWDCRVDPESSRIYLE